jgi:hypothetical protein
MALLDLVQSVAIKVGLTAPAAAITSPDQNIQQIVYFANESGQELAHRFPWQALTKEATFVTVATESQGALATLTGPDFVSIVNETMWDRSTKRPVFGPKVPAEWQQLKAQFVNGPWSQYRIRGNQVLFIPVPAAGDNIYFEWTSNYWASTAAAPTVGAQKAFATDTDMSLLSERVILLDTVWRYKQTKGLDYSEDYDKAEGAIADLMSRDASKPTLNLSGPQGNIQPGVWVPSGNWGH